MVHIFILPNNERKKFNLSTMVPQVELFSFVFRKNLRHQKDISKLTDLYLVLSIYILFNQLDWKYLSAIAQYKRLGLYLPSKLCQQKVKGYRMTKKFNKLVPLSESELEFRTQNLCKDHLFHTDAWQFQILRYILIHSV